MPNIIGLDPNQIPINGMLGGMAYQDPKGITVEKIQSTTGVSTTFPTTNLQLQPNLGNVVIGTGTSLATTASEGHLFIPTCAGAPTGIVTAPFPGVVPLVYDTTNNRLYIRTPSGTWRFSAFGTT